MNFNFWKENKTANHFQLSAAEIADRFDKWLESQDKEAFAQYPAERTIRNFITDKDGLNSVFEENEYDSIHKELVPRITNAIIN